MATYDAFEGEQTESYQNKPEKQIWELPNIYEKKNWEDLKTWLEGMKNYLRNENRDRRSRLENNLSIYKGIQYQSQSIKEDSRDYGTDRSTAIRKVVSNQIYDLTQQKVSRLIKYKPGIAALATSNEMEARIGAKMSENLVRHIWYLQRFEGDIQNTFVKMVHVMGESYLSVLWDPEAGEDHHEMGEYESELMEKGEAVLRNDDGEAELGDDGKEIKIGKCIKIGDTVMEIWNTMDVLVDRDYGSYDRAEHFWHKKMISKSYARKKYDWNDRNVGDDSDNFYYDYEKMQMKGIKDKVGMWKVYFKKSEYLPKGAEILMIGSQVVSCKPLPFSSGKFPVCRLTDVDLTGETHGESYITFIKSLTGTYNNLTNMIVRNHVLVSHPKWMFPAGSVRKESLGNEITLCEYKGQQPPMLVQANPTPDEVFAFRDKLKEEFSQIAGISGVTRGEPPPGIKAGVALQFLAEQDNERFNEMVLKYNEWIRQVAIATIERCAENYDNDDKRMVMVMGHENKWMTEFFDVKYLKKKYDIRIQNSSALPQSKAARTQYLLDLNEQFPDQVPPEMVLDMLDISQPDKFIDYVTATVRAAEAENETIMRNLGKVVDPAEYEDHINMWKVHVKQMREWSFKNQSEESVQKHLEDHVAAHEMLMIAKSKTDPNYLEMCSTLPGWPIFFNIADALPPPPPEELPLPEEELPPPPLSPEEEAMLGAPAPVNVPPPSLLEEEAMNEELAEGPIEPSTAI